MMASKTLAVTAIKCGTVIDHIRAGQALKIVSLLHLNNHHKQVTLGLNLPSQSLVFKDIIKIEERELSQEEANQVAIFSPQATINIINDFEVTLKFKVAIPQFIASVILCPNQKCITNHEKMESFFLLKQRNNSILMQCKFCRRNFAHDEINMDNRRVMNPLQNCEESMKNRF